MEILTTGGARTVAAPLEAQAASLADAVPRSQRSYWLAWSATLLFFLAFYALLVPLPQALIAAGLSDAQIGLVLGAFGVASLIGRPLAGRATDRFGSKRVMICGSALLLLGIIGVPLASSVVALFGLRLLQALGYVAFTTAGTALVIALTPEAQRGQRLAVFGIAANVAVTMTPAAMAALLPYMTLTVAFWLAGTLALLAGIVAVAITLAPAPAQPAALTPQSSVLSPQSYATLWLPMLLSACFGLGFGAFLQFLPLLSAQRGDSATGWLYTCYGIGIMLTRVLSRRWIDRASTGWVLAVGTLCMAVGLAGLAVAATFATLALASLLIAIGGGILHPTLIAIHARRCPSAPGRATAAFYLGFDAGIGGGSWLLGLALAQFGFGGLYALAAIVVLASLAAIPALAETRRQGDKETG